MRLSNERLVCSLVTAEDMVVVVVVIVVDCHCYSFQIAKNAFNFY